MQEVALSIPVEIDRKLHPGRRHELGLTDFPGPDASHLRGRKIPAIDDAQGIHQLGAELVSAPAIISERRERPDGWELAGVDAEIRLEAPDRHQNFARHAIGLLDARQHRAILFHHVGAAREPRRDHAAGEFLKALAEYFLRAVARQHRLIERDAIEAGIYGGLGNAFACSFWFEVGATA